MASKCQKFVPNMFNKSKCQHCFAAKEAHSTAALENNKASRKVSKCGYLFVSPGFDFNNPLDRSRRWQRRFFRLYDDGEFSYCVDENPDTVPQGFVDMNKCTDVLDAQVTTTHPYSLSIITPEKTLFIKGNSKEEIQWWHDVLAVFPKALKSIKPRRKQPCLILSNKDITADSIDGILTGGDGKIDLKSCTDAPAYATFKGVRSLKHKYDTSYQEGLRKSSSLHDLSSENQEMRETLSSTRYLSRSGDRLDTLTRESIYSLSRNTPLSVHKTPVPPSPWARSSSLNSGATLMTPKNVTSSHSSISSSSSTTSDRQAANSVKNVNGKLHRERSSSLRDFPTQFSIIRDTTDKPIESTDETDSNQTDELKIAQSSEVKTSNRPNRFVKSASTSTDKRSSNSIKPEDLVYTKKGWLIKQASTDKDSHKHWFVLAGNSLRYYEDAKAEESNILEGRIDLSTCYEVSELSTHRNYGFKIKTGNGEYILAAMTLSIRNNWMKALRLCMEMHSSIPKWKLSANASHSQPRSAVDDLGFKPHTATSLTTANKGETAFQIVGHREPHKKEVPRPVRRHHSDVNPSNVSKVLSVKEFTASLEAESPSGDSSVSSAASRNMIAGALDALKTTGPAESTPKSVRLGNSREGAVKFKRDNTDSAAVTAGSGAAAQGPEHSQQNLKRNIASESTKEEVKRELMRHAKSPSARIKEKSRASKSSHSSVEEAYGFHLANALDAGSAMSDTTNDPSYNDSHLSEEDSEDYPAQEDTDNDEVGSATASDVIADDALVEILETEVETLKDRLEHTQTELDKIHKDNLDLKSRLHKESLQSVDSGYSSRWGGQNTTVSDNSQWLVSSTNNIELLKRQLKDAKDTNQRQKMDIEGLKGKLDMSVSKLTGTEKALSEALRDYKQEKDKFVKLSSEWNRRIRSMENQSKDTVHKLERSRETLQAKERECRRMEAELKTNLQKNREQEKEIVKLKAVEHEYNQLKEKLDDRDHELANLKSEMKEKDNFIKKLKEDYERQLDQLDREFGQERDDIEHHMEQLKQELYSAHDRQASMSDNMTSNIADILKEKDDIIAQLEEKMIEADKKLVDLSEELHAEMGENAELAHSIDMLQKDKVKLASTIEEFDTQLLSTRTKVSGLETENASLRRQLQELKLENAHLQESRSTLGGSTSAQADKERDELKLTVVELQRRLLDLQTKMEQVQLMADKKYERGGSMNSISSLSSDHHQDLLHNVLVVDSQLQEINTMMQHIHHSFDTYIESLPEREHSKVMKLSNLIEDVCHKCQEIQEVLREGVPHTAEPDYNHVVTVNAQSNGKIIMEEYLYLKDKFDHVVAELRKNKLSSRDHCKTCDTLRQEEIKLKEKLIKLESSCTAQVNQLLARVNKLGYGQPVPEATTHKETQCVDDIEKQLNLLEKQIITLEKMSSSVKPAVTSGTSTEGLHKLTGILQNVQAQVEAALTQAKQTDTLVSSTPSEHASVLSKLESCEKRIDSVVSKVQSGVEGSMACGSKELQSAVASGGVMNCLHEIRARVQEIGEQLDSLDEGDEDSDSENEGDQTTVEDIRDRLAQLTEYIEEHSKLTAPDWALLRLVSLQKESLAHSIESKEYLSSEADSTERKLKLFSDKLALEALILSEMGHILQTRDYLTAEDSVNREIDSLNNQVINLHQKLDNEMKTMHFEEKTTDVLSSYVELVAEKILINGQLCSGSFDKKSHVNKDISSDTPSIVQPGILAVEALLRCQLDSFIGTNLEKPSEEILDIPNHLTTHAIVQGELTFALKQLKSVLLQHPEALQPGSGNYQFMLSQLLQRQGRILGCFDSYFQQIVRSLAVIIFKESEEMTIVQGPETVLETMCSEISTVIERHIQHFKEKCRTAQNTHMAHKYDLIVNELRSIRETTLSEIKLKHEAYSGNQTSIRDSSLDIPVQSLDNTVANFGEILSLKAIMMGASIFIIELVKMGSSVLSDLELEPSDVTEENPSVEKGLFSFINILSQSLEEEALSKFCLSKKLLNEESSEGVQTEDEDKSMQSLVLQIPDLSGYSGLAELVIREAVHSAQLTFSLFKQKLTYECERGRTRGRRLVQSKTDQESRDSDDNLELQADIQALLGPMEEVLESKHEDELEVLEVFLAIVKQIKVTNVKDLPAVEEQLKQLEMKLQHEQEVAKDRHNTYLEVFKQESCKLEKTLEELQSDRDHYEERSAQLEDELNTLQLQHEEEKERVKKDILTAVHAIRSNDEKSEMHLIEKSSRMEKELAMQKVHFRKLLGSLKKDLTTKEKSTIIQAIEEHMKFISLSSEEEEEDDYQPPLPISPPPTVSGGITVPLDQPLSQNVQNVPKPLNITSHEQAVELLKREKEEALAEEIRNTKAALDAVRSAYEDELTKERDKYKEALRTMYTEDFINEIRLRNQEEEDKMREELQKLNMHYSSKCEDYKLMEMKLQQTKQDYESHISQLISSNDHLEELLNREIDSLKDFIKNKPSSLTTGSVTMEEELYDAKIMVRVKDTELQKLRSQVKNLENSLHRTTEEQKQTLTYYMQSMKSMSELKKQHQEETSQLTEKLNKVLGSQGLKVNIRRTPSFHQRARSPSPGTASSARKESDHSSRDSHRRRHIHPKDLRRSKSSPSLPFVFDNKGISPKQATPGSAAKARRSRSPKS